MTSNSSSIKSSVQADGRTTGTKKQGSFLLHNCRSYWWLALICAIVYGFAGPVYTLMAISHIQEPSRSNYEMAGTEEMLMNAHLKELATWLSGEAMIFMYLSAVVLAAIIGCIMFFYLQQKRQVHFYHSQPITRTRLFLNQYLTGLLVNVIPMVLMTVVMLLVITFFHLGAAVKVGYFVQHVGYLLLLLLASYNIAILAGQLTGTVLTQIALNGVLHFGVPVAVFLFNMLYQLFFATFYDGSALIGLSLNFSPFCAAFDYLQSALYPLENAMVMRMTAMPGSMVAILLITAAVTGLLAWVLYGKRASEAAGRSLVYPITEPLVKAYLMFVVAITAGFIFREIGGRLFFYFAVIAFAVLTHMTCEVIIQHDFKAMVRRMPQCLVILALIGVVIGIFRFDVFGYDSYLPEPDEVKQVALYVPEVDEGYYGLGDGTQGTQDATVKQLTYDLLQPIITEKQYRSSSYEGYNYSTGWESTSSVVVQYEQNNGKIVSRIYREVPLSVLEETYQELYNQQAYRDMIYRELLQVLPEQLHHLSVDEKTIYMYNRDGRRDEVTFAQATELLKAFQQDLRDRQSSVLEQIQQYSLSFEYQMIGDITRQRYVDMAVYADDERTMALLQQMGLEDRTSYEDYDQLLLFQCAAKTEQEMRSLLSDIENAVEYPAGSTDTIDVEMTAMEGAKVVAEVTDSAEGAMTAEEYIEGLSKDAQLIDNIEGEEAVTAFLKQTNLLKLAAPFCKIDQTHFALLQYSPSEDETYWSLQTFHQGMVPAQYQ